MIGAFRNMEISLNIDGLEAQGMKIQGQERVLSNDITLDKLMIIHLCEYYGEQNKIKVFLIIIKSTQQL